MAFSTQKDFFHVPFMNENVEYECKRACVKLKSYDSTIDDRSWAHDEAKQSKFLSDLVTCQFAGGKGGYGDSGDNGEGGYGGRSGGHGGRIGGAAESFSGSGGVGHAGGGIGGIGSAGGHGPGGHGPGGHGPSGHGPGSHGPSGHGLGGPGGSQKYTASGLGPASKGDGFASQMGVLSGGDSLLECANIHLADYQNVMNIKQSLEKQLEVSNDRLKTAKEENQKIKEILGSKLDSNTAKDFYNKIQKLIAAGKLGKNEENEMLQIYQKMENMYKAYEILQAENYYLKRLIEKMAARVSLDNLKTEPEKSTDVGFLQKEVTTLRKECTMLRKIEDDYQKIKQQSHKPAITEQDAENIKAIIRERNSLRDKCKSLKHLERKVQDLEQKASEAHKVAGQLSSNLNNQSNYINKVEGDLQSMQKYYEDANQNACFKEECLKSQIEDLKDELMKAKCQAQKAEMLQMEIGCLRNEVLKRDLALNDYDCQFKQLMDVVNELQAIKLQCLQDNQTQTCKNETDELAFFTGATLEEIMKELKKKGCLGNNETIDIYGLGLKPNDTDGEYNKECCGEMYRLQKQVDDMKKEFDDALKRVKDLESANAKLLHDLDDSITANAKLTEKLKLGEEKMANMLRKIEKLDGDIYKNEQDTRHIGKELDGTLGLVKDISDVQLKNQQLANAVSAINSRDDQKIIDDLRRQLEEELARLKKCQQDNNDLIKEAKERENDLKQLKDLNNKLEADKNKLEADKKKLEDEKSNLQDQHNLKNLKNDPDQQNLKNDPNQQNLKNDPNQQNLKNDPNQKNLKNDPNQQNLKNDPNQQNLKNDPNQQNLKNDPNQKNLKNDPNQQNLKNDPNQQNLKKDPNQQNLQDDNKNLISNAKTESDEKGKKGNDGKGAKGAKDIDSNENRKNIKADKAAALLDKDKAAALDEFVSKKSESFKSNLNKGRCFEKELRKMLDEFIQECRYCFCRLGNPKSKLYGICHKLYHCGMNTLSFTELGYLHKKIFDLAEQKKPGCLLTMVLEDHRDHARSLLLRQTGGAEVEFQLPQAYKTEPDQKCCCCRNELCCTNSEEMLKDKVYKLEKDIEIAREQLFTMKKIPLDTGRQTECDDNACDNYNDSSTFRAYSPQEVQQKAMRSQHLKKLKAHIRKHPDIFRI